MRIIETLADGTTRELLLLKNKDGTGYQYINLDKQHICPCKFETIEEALKDLDRLIEKGKIKKYEIVSLEEPPSPPEPTENSSTTVFIKDKL